MFWELLLENNFGAVVEMQIRLWSMLGQLKIADLM